MIAALPTMLTSLFSGGAAAAEGAAAAGGVAAEGATAAEGAAAAEGGAADSVSMSPAAQMMMMNNSSSPYGMPGASTSNSSLSDPASDDLPGTDNASADQGGNLCGVQEDSDDDGGDDGSTVDDNSGAGDGSGSVDDSGASSDAAPVDTSGGDDGGQLDADAAPESAPETDGQDTYTPSAAAASYQQAPDQES